MLAGNTLRWTRSAELAENALLDGETRDVEALRSMTKLEQLAHAAQDLAPAEQLRLVEAILEHLEPPDPHVLEQWAIEADARCEAFQRGEIEAMDWDSIRADLTR
jgi:putative addiction module component (TIGR02574 family)